MIITSEHDFSSANTYIHLGYASAQNWNVATHEMTWAASARDCGGGEAVFAVITGSWEHLWCLVDLFIQSTELWNHALDFRAEMSRWLTENNLIIY